MESLTDKEIEVARVAIAYYLFMTNDNETVASVEHMTAAKSLKEKLIQEQKDRNFEKTREA